MMYENQEWGPKMRLFCETGYNLTIRPNGDVLGVQNDDDPDTLLEILSAGATGQVRIKSLRNGLFLCFNPAGNLYGEINQTNEGSVFLEDFQGSYTGFQSKMYENWYIGIKKTGKPKNGKRTKYGQKSVKFLPRRIY